MTLKEVNTLLRKIAKEVLPSGMTLFGNGFAGNPNHLFKMRGVGGVMDRTSFHIAYLIKKLDGFDFNYSIKFGNLEESCINLPEKDLIIYLKEILVSEANKFLISLSDPVALKNAIEARMNRMKEIQPLIQ